VYDIRIIFAITDQRETLIMQMPNGNDARKRGWNDVFVVLSYTNRKLLIYSKQDDMGTDSSPIITLELSQIYSVRTLEQGEHERLRIKPNDLKMVLQLAYIDDASAINLFVPTDTGVGIVHVRGHYFEDSRNSSRSSCDVCGKSLPFFGGIYECKSEFVGVVMGVVSWLVILVECQMKCHKDDIEKVDLVRPCVAGKEMPLIIKW
jgi:hypothetical protein